jgi:hypothetical protein
MKLLNKLGVLILVLMIVSCAATKPSIPEVKLPLERISLKGYSVMPLNEPGWMIAGRNYYRVDLAKAGTNPDETFAIQGMMSKLATFNTNTEFVQLVKEWQAKDTDAQRFKIISHEVTSFPMAGIECARSHMVIEDRAAVKRTNDSRDMILEVLTLSCAHPSDKSVGIHVTYSHRHYPGQEDPAFIEKGMSVLNSVELFAPDEPYITAAQKSSLKFADNFSAFCSKIIEQPLPPPGEVSKENGPPPLAKLSSLGVMVERESSGNRIGSYALFEKGKDDAYLLISIKSTFIEPIVIGKQEELFVSAGLDMIAPAFAKQVYIESKQAFRCASGTSLVTGIGTAFRSVYNPCDSALTSASNVGSTAVANSLLTVLSLGTNVVTGSSVSFVDTDKEKVAKLVVDSKLLQCLKEANANGLKNEFAVAAAKAAEADSKEAIASNKSKLEKIKQ